MDGGVVLADAVGQASCAAGLRGDRGQGGYRWQFVVDDGGGFGQQGPVLEHGLLHGLGEVVPQVVPVRDVDRVGGADASGLGERAGAVAADHLDPRMGCVVLGDLKISPLLRLI
ncbi:hypothetical protein [Streptomyces sp. BE303]|uniref:hypothetical protein n=1 Tax=Streptomyces sp. BE303 TaxID=3002528 RepID=UPI002E76808B|nr:hypothetical protein [Streptomyces sp. BE303]MED7947408.1 hypothetical protein [Streptomyces sp. BE303]